MWEGRELVTSVIWPTACSTFLVPLNKSSPAALQVHEMCAKKVTAVFCSPSGAQVQAVPKVARGQAMPSGAKAKARSEVLGAQILENSRTAERSSSVAMLRSHFRTQVTMAQCFCQRVRPEDSTSRREHVNL